MIEVGSIRRDLTDVKHTTDLVGLVIELWVVFIHLRLLLEIEVPMGRVTNVKDYDQAMDSLDKLIDAKFLAPFFLLDEHEMRFGYIELAGSEEAQECGIIVSLGDESTFIFELLLDLVERVLLDDLRHDVR